MKFSSIISHIGKPLNPAEALANRSSSWVAKHFGISRRQAQRYKSGRAPLNRPQDQAKRDRVMKSADSDTRRKVAADAMRNAQAANVGRVRVTSDTGRAGARSGTRNVGLVDLDEEARELMSEAADLLEAGDYEGAADKMNDALLNTNGRNYGPLRIEDYPPGFHLI